MRSAARRVDGSSGAKSARSHARPTDGEKSSPSSPVDSVCGRSVAWRYTVAVEALIQTGTGCALSWIARPSSAVVSTRERRISRRLATP